MVVYDELDTLALALVWIGLGLLTACRAVACWFAIRRSRRRGAVALGPRSRYWR